jgi:hypothetical protein
MSSKRGKPGGEGEGPYRPPPCCRLTAPGVMGRRGPGWAKSDEFPRCFVLRENTVMKNLLDFIFKTL